MRNLGVLLALLGLLVLAHDAMSQRGGAARGGVRGAVVGGVVGGSEGAATGAKVGVITGATRTAIGRETTARTQYQSTAEYQNAAHANFIQAPPDILGAGSTGTAQKPSGEAVIRKDGKPIVGITFPGDWKQKTGANYISAVSADAQAYAMLVTLEELSDKKARARRSRQASRIT